MLHMKISSTVNEGMGVFRCVTKSLKHQLASNPTPACCRWWEKLEGTPCRLAVFFEAASRSTHKRLEKAGQWQLQPHEDHTKTPAVTQLYHRRAAKPIASFECKLKQNPTKIDSNLI